MLPPGHIAASFLASYEFLKITHPQFELSQINFLLAVGTFFGFAPDLDMFFAFAKEKAFVIKDSEKHNHRKYLTHAPALWLILSLLIYFVSKSELEKYVGLMILVGSFSHFILDSIEHGIMWFWPFSNKIYALKDAGSHYEIDEKNFIRHWWKSLQLYFKSVSFYLEILLIILVFIIYFK